MGGLKMEKEFNKFKNNFFNYIRCKKKKCTILCGTVLTLSMIIGISIIKNNNVEVLAYAKVRNESLGGMTISNLALNHVEDLKKGPTKSYGKVVYITIDDGPSQYTDQIINILRDNNIKATFFMIEGRMQEYQDQVKNIVNSGNVAGFHSVSHDVNKLYVNNDSAKQEFDVNQATFNSITGQNSNIIRLPYGSKPYTPVESYEELVNAGYKLWDWNLDTVDWCSTPEQIISNVKKYSVNKDNIVLLMHEREQSVKALEEIIKYYKDEGYEFLTINEHELERNFWLENLNND